MRSVFQDMKTAWRRARRSPAYGLVVIATLGLTLSALATMVAIVEAVILRPLPYREPDRIVAVWEARPAEGQERFRMAAGNFNDVRSLKHLFENGALFGAAGFRRSHVLGALARLRPDTTIERARGELDALAARLARESAASNRDTKLRLVPLSEEFSGSSRRLLFTLTAAAVVIVVLGVANLIGLALSRVAERRHETAIRLSLGASRAALLREVSVEAMVLALTGAAAGLVLARLAGPAISATVPVEIPRIEDANIGWMPILLTCVASTLCAAGLTGALSMSTSRLSMTESLQGGGTRGAVGHRRTGHRGMIVLQVALSVILLSVAGLFSRSLVRLGQIDPGFDADSVLTADVSLPQSAYPQWDRVVHFYGELLERLSERPGVVAAGAGYDLPLQSSWIDSFTLISGARGTEGASAWPDVRGNRRSAASRRRGGQRELRAGASRRRDGCVGRAASLADSVPHVVVSDCRGPARGASDGVPNRRRRGGHENPRTGQDPAPIVYLPAAQFPQSGMTILVRATREPIALATELRAAVAALDSTVPVARIETLRDVLHRQTARPRFAVVIVGVFAGVALLLSAVGVYGLLALVVGSRTREIAVRVAVGARRSDIAAQFIGQACWLGGVGAALGIAGALLTGRAIENLLFEVGGADLVTLTAAPAVLMATVLLAAAWPTRRALRVDPGVILRG